jgi:hypothetical protein
MEARTGLTNQCLDNEVLQKNRGNGKNMEHMGGCPSLCLNKIVSESSYPELRLRLGLIAALVETWILVICAWSDCSPSPYITVNGETKKWCHGQPSHAPSEDIAPAVVTKMLHSGVRERSLLEFSCGPDRQCQDRRRPPEGIFTITITLRSQLASNMTRGNRDYRRGGADATWRFFKA